MHLLQTDRSQDVSHIGCAKSCPAVLTRQSLILYNTAEMTSRKEQTSDHAAFVLRQQLCSEWVHAVTLFACPLYNVHL